MRFFPIQPSRAVRPALPVVLSLLLVSCAALESLLTPPREPTARIDRVEITGLSFDDVELTAFITVENPNTFGVTLSGYDYALDVAEGTPLAGSSSEGLAIEAEGSSSFAVPFRLSYRDVFETLSALSDRNETEYRVRLTPRFEVPVIGDVAFELSHSGVLPVLRLPEIRFDGVEVAALSLTRVDLAVTIEIRNENPAPMNLLALPYRFELGGRELVSGDLDSGREVAAGERQRRTFDVSVGLLDAGRTLYDAVVGSERLAYRFEGRLTFAIDLPLVEPVTIPILLSGNERVAR